MATVGSVARRFDWEPSQANSAPAVSTRRRSRASVRPTARWGHITLLTTIRTRVLTSTTIRATVLITTGQLAVPTADQRIQITAIPATVTTNNSSWSGDERAQQIGFAKSSRFRLKSSYVARTTLLSIVVLVRSLPTGEKRSRLSSTQGYRSLRAVETDRN